MKEASGATALASSLSVDLVAGNRPLKLLAWLCCTCCTVALLAQPLALVERQRKTPTLPPSLMAQSYLSTASQPIATRIQQRMAGLYIPVA
jgi:hypothetical protein